MTKEIPKRGPSSGSKRAAKYFAEHPDATAKELAKKFAIDLTTIYRATWWQAAKKDGASNA